MKAENGAFKWQCAHKGDNEMLYWICETIIWSGSSTALQQLIPLRIIVVSICVYFIRRANKQRHHGAHLLARLTR